MDSDLNEKQKAGILLIGELRVVVGFVEEIGMTKGEQDDPRKALFPPVEIGSIGGELFNVLFVNTRLL